MKVYSNTKLLMHIDHIPSSKSNISTINYVLKWLAKKVGTTFNGDVVTTVSRFTYEKLRKELPNKKIIITGNGVDVDVFKPIRIKREAYSIFSWGLFYKRKNFSDLILAFKKIKKELPKATLRIAGDGPERNELIRLVTELKLHNEVKFLGKIKNEKLVKEINKADVVATTSLLEGFSLTSLEAMACGKPVVAYNIGGLNEIVLNGKNGILVSSQDVTSFSNAIIKLVRNRELLQKLGEQAFYFSHRYSWDIVADKEIRAVLND
jgi:glycosyltransferase involved in cell wall biosynthesis